MTVSPPRRTPRLAVALLAVSVTALVLLVGGAMADPDGDLDRVPDAVDNCPALFNPDQEDADGDGFGNTCDPTLGIPPDESDAVLYLRDQRGHPITGDACFEATTFTTQGPEEPQDLCVDPIRPGWASVSLGGPDDLRVEIVQKEAPPGCTGGLVGTRTHTFSPGSWEIVVVRYTCQIAAGDRDLDGKPDGTDNCPDAFNPDQLDEDEDGLGNTCDRTPGLPGNESSAVFYLRDQDGVPLWDACFDVTQYTTGQQPDQGTNCVELADPGWAIFSLVAPDDVKVEMVQAASPPGCRGGLQGKYTYPFTQSTWRVVNLRYTCGLPVVFADALSPSRRTRSHALRVVSTTQNIAVVVRWQHATDRFDVSGLGVAARSPAWVAAEPGKLKITRTQTPTSLTLHLKPGKLKPGELAGQLRFTVVAKSIRGGEKVRTRVTQARG